MPYLMARRRRPLQQVLPFGPRPTLARPKHWKTPGRKPHPERTNFVKHVARSAHDHRHPVHVVMRCVRAAPHLRAERLVTAIAAQLRRAVHRGVGLVHYSIQGDHLHLIVEAPDGSKLARNMQWLFSQIAFEVNRIARRSGRLFADRHFRHPLRTPSEVRRALVYVLMNGRKHGALHGRSLLPLFEWLDPCSSAGWFEGWREDDRPSSHALAQARAGPCPPGAPPTTWLAEKGWLRGGGPIALGEMPSFKLA
jgi:putative transposase